LTFIHTPLFDESMADAGMTDAELRQLQAALQADPDAGDLIPGTGGARTVRIRARSRGKRGGGRVVYYHRRNGDTIYLPFVYTKAQAADLSAAGKRVVRKLIQEL